MKILHITNAYPTDAYPVYGIFIKEQIDSLNCYDICNTVFFINGREKGLREYFFSILRLRVYFKNNSFNIVHCHHVLSALIYLFATIFRRNEEKRVVSFLNNPVNEFKLFGKLLSYFLYKIVEKHFTIIILKDKTFNSENRKIVHLPNGVNTDIFYPMEKVDAKMKLSLNVNKIYILFVSSNYIRAQKRYDIFKQVINILRDRYHLNIEEIILTNTKRELVPVYYNAADLHLLTSDFEGSPNSVKECLACNTPVVSTDVGNVKEMIDGLNSCKVARTNNPDELAKLAYEALNSEKEDLRNVIFQKELDMTSVAQKLINLYKTS